MVDPFDAIPLEKSDGVRSPVLLGRTRVINALNPVRIRPSVARAVPPTIQIPAAVLVGGQEFDLLGRRAGLPSGANRFGKRRAL